MSNKPIIIGIDARMLGAEQTGIGRYITHLTDELFRRDTTNQYVMFLLPHEYKKYTPPSPRVRKVMVTSPWYGWHEQLVLPWQFIKERLDLLHVPHFNAPMCYPGKLVVTIHDITQLYFPGPRGIFTPVRHLAYKAVFGSAVRKAAKIIAVSQYTKSEIIQKFSVPDSKIEVIYEGLPNLADSASQIANRTTGDTRFAIRDKPYILYVGVWRPHKNIPRLLEAFSIMKKNPAHDTLKLVLVGKENPRYPEVRQAIGRLGLAREVITPGFLDDTALEAYYRGAKAVVIPSLVEGFGFVGLEALSYGIPVAASEKGALPEILGGAALYFDPESPPDMAEKLAQLISDNALRARTLASAEGILRRYSWSEAAAKTLRAYEQARAI